MDIPFDFSPAAAGVLALAFLGAAFVRGYAGFGFSALVVAVAGLLGDPRPVVPLVILCELAITALQARGLRGVVDWRRVLALLAGAAIGLPPAVMVLSRIGPATAQIAISALILVLSLVLASGWRLGRRIGTTGTAGVGVISGLANGAAVGGLPVGVFLSAQPIAPARFRATMIVYLTGLDLIALPLFAQAGLMEGQTLAALLWVLPLVIVGALMGGRRFRLTAAGDFRRLIVGLLMLLAALGIFRGGIILAAA